MKTIISGLENRKTFFFWLVTILAVIVVPLVYVAKTFSKVPTTIVGVISTFLILLAAWLSGLNSKSAKWFEMVPGLLLIGCLVLLVLAFSSGDIYFGLVCLFLITTIAPPAILFLFFYRLDKFLRKSSIKNTILSLIIELIVIVVFVVSLLQQLHLNSSITSLKESDSVDPATASQVCNSFSLEDERGYSCWTIIINKNPGVAVCSNATDTHKEQCLGAMQMIYEDNGCRQTYPSSEYTDSSQTFDTAAEIKRSHECWGTAATKYPGLDVCKSLSGYAGSPWSNDKCYSFLDPKTSTSLRIPPFEPSFNPKLNPTFEGFSVVH